MRERGDMGGRALAPVRDLSKSKDMHPKYQQKKNFNINVKRHLYHKIRTL